MEILVGSKLIASPLAQKTQRDFLGFCLSKDCVTKTTFHKEVCKAPLDTHIFRLV